MHPAIGQLSNGMYYSFIHGHDAEPFTGSLEQVEVAMGLRPASPNRAVAELNAVPHAEAAPAGRTYTVTLTFQYPAWDEVDGISYHEIQADSKSEANSIVRKMAEGDGHLGRGKGRASFEATEQ